eukprot:2341146-Alexandrium_andersonii.AAC.1
MCIRDSSRLAPTASHRAPLWGLLGLVGLQGKSARGRSMELTGCHAGSHHRLSGGSLGLKASK